MSGFGVTKVGLRLAWTLTEMLQLLESLYNDYLRSRPQIQGIFTWIVTRWVRLHKAYVNIGTLGLYKGYVRLIQAKYLKFP